MLVTSLITPGTSVWRTMSVGYSPGKLHCHAVDLRDADVPAADRSPDHFGNLAIRAGDADARRVGVVRLFIAEGNAHGQRPAS